MLPKGPLDSSSGSQAVISALEGGKGWDLCLVKGAAPQMPDPKLPFFSVLGSREQQQQAGGATLSGALHCSFVVLGIGTLGPW